MSNFDVKKVKEIFCRLFVLATENKMNLEAFTNHLAKSNFASSIENNSFSDSFNLPLEKVFYEITGNNIDKDTSFGVFNDAYWCGYSYFEIQQRTRKSFALIFLKLPFAKLIDLYPIYHEMDITSLLDFFNKLNADKTILRLLCQKNNCSLKELSNKTGINKATLAKYNANDEYLLKASFNNVYRIANYFDVPYSLFL